MKHKKAIVAGISIFLVLSVGRMENIYAVEPETDQNYREEQDIQKKTEGRLCTDIWEEIGYMAVNLGNCYPGSRAEYDIRRNRTILYPSGWQKQLVVREKEKAELYYGKYRGKIEYEDYQAVSPILDVDFFWNPIRALELTTEDVDRSGAERKVVIEEEQQLELFYAPLVYEGILNDEETILTAVTLRFDEEYLLQEVLFTLESEGLSEEQLVNLENELTQSYSYMELSEFAEHLDVVKATMAEIVPEDEITIADYVTDLNNILQVEDEYFLQRLTHQGEELSFFSGWDKRAVLAYLEAVNTKFNAFAGNGYEAANVTKEEYLEELENTYQSARQIGSDVYAYLEAVNTKFNAFAGNGYEAANVTKEEYLEELENTYQSARQIGSDVYTYMFETSKMEAKKKALLVLRQMGAYMDANGMLQFGNGDRFAPDMAPHAAFLEDYAECVREAYKKKKSYRTLDNQMIHQFRMYIDRHNIEYVRKHFKGSTDYAKLQAYAEHFEMKLYYGEPSRHHNKILRGEKFQKQKFDKILTSNRLSEFIINVENGSFVTQWDVLEIKKDGTVASGPEGYLKRKNEKQSVIVDTESFNYAPADYVKAHNALDVLPATPPSGKKDSFYLENHLKSALKEVWESPSRMVYRETYKSSKEYLK